LLIFIFLLNFFVAYLNIALFVSITYFWILIVLIFYFIMIRYMLVS